MNEHDFRRIATGMSGAVEGAHMGHPDFRIKNRIFASILPDPAFGTVMLTPDVQARFLHDCPDAFRPAPGAWGLGGATTVRLAAVDEEVLGEAVTLAYQNAVAKGPTKPVRKRSPRAVKRPARSWK